MKNPGIYVITNKINGNKYVGKTSDLERRVKEHLETKGGRCPGIHDAITKYGKENFDVEYIRYPGISPEALREVEKWKIRQYKSHASQGGYNLTWGGDGIDSERSKEMQQKRVQEGIHHWLGQNNPSHRRMEEGTHNFIGLSRKRVEEGTHHWLGPENNMKRVREGTHHLLGKNNHNYKKAKEGTHPWIGNNNPSHKRVKEGTHNFQDKSFRSMSVWKIRLKMKRKRRKMYRIFSCLLTSRSILLEYRHRQLVREGVFDKKIPDTSKASQLSLL